MKIFRSQTTCLCFRLLLWRTGSAWGGGTNYTWDHLNVVRACDRGKIKAVSSFHNRKWDILLTESANGKPSEYMMEETLSYYHTWFNNKNNNKSKLRLLFLKTKQIKAPPSFLENKSKLRLFFLKAKQFKAPPSFLGKKQTNQSSAFFI